jgi:DNA polymerase-1
MKTCMAVDGTNMVHRAYHAMENTQMRDEQGNPMWAVHGLVSMLSNFARAIQPSSMVVAFDAIGGCPSRKLLAPEYKGGRSQTPPDLLYQLPKCLEILRAMGVACVEVPDWEADDVLATIATVVAAAGSSSVIVSSDKDAHQLIDEHCSVYKPEGKFVTDVELFAKYGVAGHRWVEYAALVGEGADNLPGVIGIGPKRASALIANFADVEEAISDPTRAGTVVSAKIAAALVDGASTFRTNRLVGTLRRDLDLDLSRVRLHHIDATQANDVLEAAGLYNAARRFASVLSVF